MATLAELLDEVKFNLGGKDDMDTRITKQINEAMLQLVVEVRPMEMQEVTTFSTAAGQFEYTIGPTGDIVVPLDNYYATLALFDTEDDQVIFAGSLENFNLQRRTSTTSTGEPRKWFRYENSIYLYRQVPRDVRSIEVRYLRRPPAMSALTDTFPLNDEWVNPVEHLATALMFGKLNENEHAAAWSASYRNLLNFRETPQMIEDEAPEGVMAPITNLVTDAAD